MMSAAEICTINPATTEILARYPVMKRQDVENIMQAMQSAQHAWQATSLSNRKKCLATAVKILDEKKEYYAKLITLEMGKPITQAIAEIEKCTSLFNYYIKNSEQFLQVESIQTNSFKSYRIFQPLGIIFAIMPWNFPFWQVMRFAVPNLMLGNAGLLKHAPNTTGSALAIEQLFQAAGFPNDLFRSVIIDTDLTPYIIQHPLVAGVTLTGSPKAGQAVAACAGAALKKSVLELGGSDAYIILEDADLDFAAEQCLISRLGINTGQSCIAAKRLIVTAQVYDEFTALIIKKAQGYTFGDPLATKTQLGPLAREDLRSHLHQQVQHAIAQGGHCILGGYIPEDQGFFYPATILQGVTAESLAFKEELFGPVVSIIIANDETEAISLANQTSYGLGGAVFTRDIHKGEEIARTQIQAGTCAINKYIASDPSLPFGGIKQSGYGRELSKEGMLEFANIKTIMVGS